MFFDRTNTFGIETVVYAEGGKGTKPLTPGFLRNTPGQHEGRAGIRSGSPLCVGVRRAGVLRRVSNILKLFSSRSGLRKSETEVTLKAKIKTFCTAALH